MSTPEERRIGEALHRAADGAEPPALDAAAVVRASRLGRARRRSALIGGTGGLALVLVFGGLLWGAGQSGFTGASSTADRAVAPPELEAASGRGEEAAAVGEDDALLPACGAAPPAATGPGASGLGIGLADAGALAPGGDGVVRVTLVNAGDRAISGSLTGPIALISAPAGGADGARTVWTGPGRPAGALALAPGESLDLEVPLAAVRCAADGGGPLEAGAYALSVVVGFAADGTGGTGVVERLVSDEAPLAVR